MTFSSLKIPLGIALLAVLVIGGAYVAGSFYVDTIAGGIHVAENTSASASVGTHAPYFDLPDLDGGRVKLSAYANAPLILVFWATWNSAGADQIKILDDYIATHGKDATFVPVLAVSSQEEKSIVSSFMHRGGYRVHTVLDQEGTITNTYGVKSLPTLFFLDSEGVIRAEVDGVLSQKMIVDNFEKIIK